MIATATSSATLVSQARALTDHLSYRQERADLANFSPILRIRLFHVCRRAQKRLQRRMAAP